MTCGTILFDTRHIVFSMTSLKFLQTTPTAVVILEPADSWREQQCGIKCGIILSQPQETGLPLLVSFKNDQQVNSKKGGKG